ncbi:MAG TPA: M90 family metallopeptidase [Gemmatimonadales bacterium]|nr:M90 family metallopeptidase [Gemmatimonadales bacterium]
MKEFAPQLGDFVRVLGTAAALILLGYFVLARVLRRLPLRAMRLPSGPLPPTWRAILERDVPLARHLSPEERERLLRLVQVFLRDKHIEGCGGLIVTEEMKVTIAAEACLLLLHWDGPVYPLLRTVLVYPEGFVPKKAVGRAVTGEIDSSLEPEIGESWQDGVVVISWADAARAAQGQALDGENVVLHEFAHQLDQADGVAYGAQVLPTGALRTWGRVLSTEYERLRGEAAEGRPSVLDPYGATNKAEFFAVATEAFFEHPLALEQERPELYAQLRAFYRQDPARRTPPAP